MSTVVFDITMSLDGYITDPYEGAEELHGGDPGQLHNWMFADRTEADAGIEAEMHGKAGAIVIGRRMFDVGFEPWGDPPPFHKPVFVLTHRVQDAIPMQGGTTYHFVTGGIEAAIEQAAAAAGEKNVAIWGGANIIQQALRAGLIDAIHIHIAPVLMGDGVRLFEQLGGRPIKLKRTRSIDTPGATHLQFTVVK